MARRTLWDIAFDEEDDDIRSYVALIMVFVIALACVVAVAAFAIVCWSQHWLLGLIATVCPIVGLYHTVTKEPSQ